MTTLLNPLSNTDGAPCEPGVRHHWMKIVAPYADESKSTAAHLHSTSSSEPLVMFADVYLGTSFRLMKHDGTALLPGTSDLNDAGKMILAVLLDQYPGSKPLFTAYDIAERPVQQQAKLPAGEATAQIEFQKAMAEGFRLMQRHRLN